MEDKTPCVWVNRVKNSLGFLQAGHRSTTFSVLFCPVVHHTPFVLKPWIKTRLNLFERQGVSLSPLSLHPLKPKSWQPRTFTDTHTHPIPVCLFLAPSLSTGWFCLMAVAYSLQARDYGDNIKLSGFVQLSGVLLQCNQQWNGRGPLGWKHKSAAGQQSWKPVNGRFAL